MSERERKRERERVLTHFTPWAKFGKSLNEDRKRRVRWVGEEGIWGWKKG